MNVLAILPANLKPSRGWVPVALLVSLICFAYFLPRLEPVFRALFPAQERPMYLQDSFLTLLVAHAAMVLLSSGVALMLALGVGVWVTRPMGRQYRASAESLVAMGQTFPPVAVLALAVPLTGFGERPAFIALCLYGLLPILHAVIAGLEATPQSALEAARGSGFSSLQCFLQVELPLAAPVIMAGVRTSVTINIGTAAIAATVGSQNLGTPIIVGLSGFNNPYVIQGAFLIGLLAATVDSAFEYLAGILKTPIP